MILHDPDSNIFARHPSEFTKEQLFGGTDTMSGINDYAIRLAPLSKRIVLARFGKDKNVALETKDAMNEFLQVLVQYAFDDGGKLPAIGDEAEVCFGAGNEQFVLTLKRIEISEERAA